MTQVYISAGSNSNRQQNIALALMRLKKQFGELTLSPVYESEAVDGRGGNYYNLAAGFQTELPVVELRDFLRQVEDELGRKRNASGKVNIDLDLLLYGQLQESVGGIQLPHPDLLRYRHVLQPLADIAGNLCLPGSEQPLHSLLNEPGMMDSVLECVSGQ